MFVATYVANILVNYFYGPFATKKEAEHYFEFFDYEPSKHYEGVWTNSGNFMLGCPPSSMALAELTPPPSPMPSCGPWSKAFVVADVSMSNHKKPIGPFTTEDDAESYLKSQGYRPETYRPYIWATYVRISEVGVYLPDREAIIVKVRGWRIA